MRCALTVALALGLLCAGRAEAQKIRFGLSGLGMSYAETSAGRSWDGGGGAGSVVLRVGRFGLDAYGFTAKLKADSATVSDFDMLQGDVRASFFIVPVIAIELGFGRRATDPDFATQDFGLWRFGILSEMPLTSLGLIWIRGAYLAPKFEGGGDVGLSAEVGLGIAVGTANGRFRVRADYEFQRIDREVEGQDVPIQTSLAKLGVEVGF
jgi:hypothetical protein